MQTAQWVAAEACYALLIYYIKSLRTGETVSGVEVCVDPQIVEAAVIWM